MSRKGKGGRAGNTLCSQNERGATLAYRRYPSFEADPYFRPPRSSWWPDWLNRASHVLIAVMALVYLIDFLLPGRPLLSLGWNSAARVAAGEVYRLVTAIFLHASLPHLLANSLSIYILGNLVETMIGWRRFLVLFFASGLVGSAASLFFATFAASVGASGAVFGLLGYILFVRWRRPFVIPPAMQQWVTVMLILNVIFSFMPGIDRWAHFGGLAGGFVAGFAVGLPGQRPFRSPVVRERLLAAAAVLLILAAVILSLRRYF